MKHQQIFRRFFIVLGIIQILIFSECSAQKVPFIFNQQFSISSELQTGLFTKLSGYTTDWFKNLSINCSYTESVQKKYTILSSIAFTPKYTDGYRLNFYDKNGGYLGAKRSTINKSLAYLVLDVTALYHFKDTLIDSRNDNYHVKRNIQGLRLGFVYRHHEINDVVNADKGTTNDSLFIKPPVPGYVATGSVSDDGIQWGGEYYSSSNKSGKTMPNLYHMPPSISNILIPSVAIGYGFLHYIDNYIPEDKHENLKISGCPPTKKSGHRRFINYYADVLIGYPYIQAYKDSEGRKHKFTPGKSTGYTREYVGFRAGIEYSYGRRYAFKSKLEFARYPDLRTYYNYDHFRYIGIGTDFNNLCFVNITIGMCLNKISKHSINKMNLYRMDASDKNEG